MQKEGGRSKMALTTAINHTLMTSKHTQPLLVNYIPNYSPVTGQ